MAAIIGRLAPQRGDLRGLEAKHGEFSMHAEVMSIGDELTSGQRLDTNTQWLSASLGDLGVVVRYHTTVADELADLVGAFRIALRRAPLVLVTGGLGPTADDLTRQALAEATARPLELRPEVLEHIRQMFAQRTRTMPERNVIQAYFPQGSRVIPNPHGTAPGIDLAVSDGTLNSRVWALPGVPAEMREMWEQTVRPDLVAQLGTPQVVCHHRIKCFGVGESHLESMLPDLIRRERDPRVGITVHQATITLRITTTGPDAAACRAKMEPTIETIRECLGHLVYGEEDDELADVVLRELRGQHQTLAVGEWGTGGLVARALAQADSICGASAEKSPWRGAIVLRCGEDLARWLAWPVPPVEIPREAAARTFVEQLAVRVREQTDADWGLAVGPAPSGDDPDPHLHFGLAGPTRTWTIASRFAGHPDVVLERAAKQALDLVRRRLHGWD